MIRFRRFLPALLAGAMSLPAAAAESGFDRAAWQDDYTYLKQSLQSDYANLAWLGSPQGGVDLPALDRQTRRALEGAENNAQAEQAIRGFVAGFHDGHFSFLATLAPGEKAQEPASPGFAGLDAAAGCAAIGSSPAGHQAFSLPLETLPQFHLQSDGIARPLRSGVATVGEVRIGVLRLQEFEAGPYPALCLAAWDGIRNLPSRGKMLARLEDRWYAAVADVLRGFAREGVDLVLVDVGDNPGGDDSGDMLTRLFTDKPLHSAPLLVSQAATGADYLDEQIELLTETLREDAPDRDARALLERAIADFSASRRAITQDTCDLSWVWSERRDWNAGHCRRLVAAGSSGGPLDYLPAGAVADPAIARRLNWAQSYREHWGAWNGPLYVLIDGKTYSSAEMFAARLRDNGVARTIGVRSGGDGCGFMVDAEPAVLPHSRLRLRMPNCVRLRGDGSNEVAGIAADLPVAPREGESARARALRLLETVTADWRSRHGH